MSTLPFFFAMVAVGYAAQFADGSLGMGYGAFSASLLITIGLSPAIASASVHTAEIFTTLVSGASHLKLGNVTRDLVLPLAIPGSAGGVLGACLIASVSGDTIRPFVASVLLVVGILVVHRFVTGTSLSTQGSEGATFPKLLVLGFVAGFMDAVGGGGWGPIATPSLILAGDHEPRTVVGSVNVVEFFVTAAEVLTFMLVLGLERFRWDIVGALLIGGVIAAPMAAFLCKRLPPRILGILIGLTLIGLNIRTLVLSILK